MKAEKLFKNIEDLSVVIDDAIADYGQKHKMDVLEAFTAVLGVVKYRLETTVLQMYTERHGKEEAQQRVNLLLNSTVDDLFKGFLVASAKNLIARQQRQARESN